MKAAWWLLLAAVFLLPFVSGQTPGPAIQFVEEPEEPASVEVRCLLDPGSTWGGLSCAFALFDSGFNEAARTGETNPNGGLAVVSFDPEGLFLDGTWTIVWRDDGVGLRPDDVEVVINNQCQRIPVNNGLGSVTESATYPQDFTATCQENAAVQERYTIAPNAALCDSLPGSAPGVCRGILGGDFDRDGFPNEAEITGNSHPRQSGSTPFTDDDGDGTPNHAESSPVCSGAYGIVSGHDCGGYAAAPGGCTDRVCYDDQTGDVYVWEIEEPYGYREAASVGILFPATVEYPGTPTTTDADGDGVPRIRFPECSRTVYPDGSMQDHGCSATFTTTGDPQDTNPNNPIPNDDVEAYQDFVVGVAQATIQDALDFVGDRIEDAEDLQELLLQEVGRLEREVGNLTDDLDPDELQEFVMHRLGQVQATAEVVEQQALALVTGTVTEVQGTQSCISAEQASYNDDLEGYAAAYLADSSAENFEALYQHATVGFEAHLFDVGACSVPGNNITVAVVEFYQGAVAEFDELAQQTLDDVQNNTNVTGYADGQIGELLVSLDGLQDYAFGTADAAQAYLVGLATEYPELVAGEAQDVQEATPQDFLPQPESEPEQEPEPTGDDSEPLEVPDAAPFALIIALLLLIVGLIVLTARRRR